MSVAETIPRTEPMLSHLRTSIVGRCRQVRVRKDDTTLPWMAEYGFDLRYFYRKGCGVLPPCECLGDLPAEGGWNYYMHRLFTTREGAQEVADALNDEIEAWCANERKLNKEALRAQGL